MPFERGIHNNGLDNGWQPAAVEPVDVMEVAIRGFENPAPYLEFFHMRVALRELLRKLSFLRGGLGYLTDKHKGQSSLHAVR